ncbi:helix-turn-helix transcriptional regulator [Haliea sp.]
MDMLYSYNGSDAKKVFRDYAKVIREEFYQGDLELDSSDHFEVAIEKALGYPISVMRVKSTSGISFRRSMEDIRENQIGVRVIWFITRGSLALVRSANSYGVESGECCILDSSDPFLAHAEPDSRGVFEASQAIVPAHLFLTHLADADELNEPFPIHMGGRRLITRFLDIMIEDGDCLTRVAAESLVTSFLISMADCLASRIEDVPKRQSLIDRRFEDIDTYIAKHLTDPDLNYVDVAKNCGISTRHLCHVLKIHNTSFSERLWSQRMVKAHDWLLSDKFIDQPIYHIAYMAGFKSAAHFSRMFKEVYGISPKECRVAGATRAPSHRIESVDCFDILK